ncbi:hypothetical protein BN903_2 [Halorubrum sp. AJ67]|nr:hypothetical protein BN903_2 [Halorubrum sp. AJ67]
MRCGAGIEGAAGRRTQATVGPQRGSDSDRVRTAPSVRPPPGWGFGGLRVDNLFINNYPSV